MLEREMKVLSDRIDSYLQLYEVELTKEQVRGILMVIEFWYEYTVEEDVTDTPA